MLTKEQLLERRKGIGASDAPKIIAGEWHQLWLEKTGKVEPEDLSGVFAVQLGSVTEQLNLDWYERKTGRVVQNRGVAVVMSPDMPYMRCNLDGQDKTDDTIIEAKHVNAYSKIEDVKARYTPQCIHQMIVTGARKAILSVIIGTNEPVLEEIEYDAFFANEYIDQCRQFWHYVEADLPPPQGAPMLVEAVAPEKMRKVDMTGNNAFAAGAVDWLANKDAAKKYEAAQKDLKALVEADVCEAAGHGIIIKRSKAGSLTIKEKV